jgi:TPR repeat protein
MMSIARLLYLVLLCASLITVQATAGEIEDAELAYKRKDYSTALSLWRPLAEQGNVEAQRGLGILYENGLAVGRDEKLATDLFRKAALGGDAEAQYRLGMRLVMGIHGLARDTAEGLKWMVQAGEHGRPNSLTTIGGFFRIGSYGLAKDPSQAVSWFRKAADLGDPEGQAWLGWAYRWGMGVAPDTTAAVSWLTKAAEQSYYPAQIDLGEIFERGEGVAVNKAVALCWYRKANTDSPSLNSMVLRAIARLEPEVAGGASDDHCH